ncbi:MAG TPA: LacI family DNA-binding transcriptional regulator [Candidatus Dormibacteraeota bacterium]|nr:LacI family DNA-binding transcriptional regulator [Candidatus Dormibacteraeota bacterium]
MGAQRRERHVSVKDVAARSGVSFQTTSKVLNGKGSVSDVTRARILRAARELGYVPNLLARSLVMHATRAIGLVAGDLSDHNLSRFIVGAEQEARHRGYSVIVTGVDNAGTGGGEALPALIERRVDGILLAAPDLEVERGSRPVQGDVPIVSLHHVAVRVNAVVGCDDEMIGRVATAHLVERGHRRIATLIGPRARRATTGRLAGYRRALDDGGVAFDEALVVDGGDTIELARAATRALLERHPDVTAVFAQNDTMAVGALAALRELGRSVPAECAVVGCDDIEVAAYTAPPLTTVRVPFNRVGEEAMRMLLDTIEEAAPGPPPAPLPVELVVRAST